MSTFEESLRAYIIATYVLPDDNVEARIRVWRGGAHERFFKAGYEAGASSRRPMPTTPCPMCDGTGTPPPEIVERIKRGEEEYRAGLGTRYTREQFLARFGSTPSRKQVEALKFAGAVVNAEWSGTREEATEIVAGIVAHNKAIDQVLALFAPGGAPIGDDPFFAVDAAQPVGAGYAPVAQSLENASEQPAMPRADAITTSQPGGGSNEPGPVAPKPTCEHGKTYAHEYRPDGGIGSTLCPGPSAPQETE